MNYVSLDTEETSIRRNVCNTPNVSNACNTDSENIVTEEIVAVYVTEPNVQQNTPNVSRFTRSPSTSTTPTFTFSVSDKKRKCSDEPLYAKRGEQLQYFKEAVDSIKNYANSSNEPTPKQDAFDALGIYIASKLRAMNSQDAKHCETEILQIFVKYN